MRYLRSLAPLFCILIGSIAVSCGGSNSSAPPPPSNPSPSPTPAKATTSVAVPAAGGLVAAPALRGYSATFTLPANNAPAGTMGTLTTWVPAPANASALTRHRFAWLRDTTSITPIVSFGASLGSPGITFDATSVTLTITLPAGSPTSGSFYVALGDLTTAVSLGTFGPGVVSGDTVTFTKAVPTHLLGTDSFIVQLYNVASASPSPSPSASASPSPSPSPSPSKSPSPSPSPSLSPSPSPSPSSCGGALRGSPEPISATGGSLTIPAECGFSGTLSYPANTAPSGTIATVISQVPNPTGPLTIPAGATYLINIQAVISNTTTFGAGFFALSLHVPISTTTHTFYIIGCGPVTFTCAGTPVTYGPLSTSGSTVSFSGIPGSFVAPGDKYFEGQMYYTKSI